MNKHDPGRSGSQIATSSGVPVISIAELNTPATLAALDAACRDWGFFQVVDHGVPVSVTAAVLRVMRDFFSRPGEEKQRIVRTAANPWGFYDRELTKNTRDWKEIYDYGPADERGAHPQWPSRVPGFRRAVLDYYGACRSLSLRLLGALSMNLGMPADHLSRAFDTGHSSFLRLNYYPVCPQPERPEGLTAARRGRLGINHHTDAGALTVLLQDDQPGLEVYRHGRWHLVEPTPQALVINIGDIVQVWSNDRYPASLHRVLANPEHARYSAPFFLNPAYSTDYAPLPSVVDAEHPARYRPINWGEFRSGRAAGDYADLGAEIQIRDFAV